LLYVVWQSATRWFVALVERIADAHHHQRTERHPSRKDSARSGTTGPVCERENNLWALRQRLTNKMMRHYPEGGDTHGTT